MAHIIACSSAGLDRLTDVPNGEWAGLWTGNTIQAKCGHKDWTFIVDEGIRGINEPCVVTVRNGTASVQHGTKRNLIQRYKECRGQVDREWIVRDVLQHPHGPEYGVHELFREAIEYLI